MEIVAHTKENWLIEATSTEVKEILRSVLGKPPEEIKIGQKMPAVDYAASITKLKGLKENYDVKVLFNKADAFNERMNNLREVVFSEIRIQ